MPNALERGLNLLAALADRDDGLSFSECCQITSAPENSCMRLLQGLCSAGWLEKNEDGRYRQGQRSEGLFSPADPMRRLQEQCVGTLNSLHERVHNTCLCIGWHDPEMITLARVLDEDSVALQPPGRVADNHDAPPWGWLFKGRSAFRKNQRAPKPSSTRIHSELDRFDQHGWCFDEKPDRRRLASPVYNRQGSIIGALAVGGTAHSIPDNSLAHCGTWLATHASALSALM